MSGITTHVLDAVWGKPAAGIAILLERKAAGSWVNVSEGMTDHDGRCRALCTEAVAGTYRLIFEVQRYFVHWSRVSIYPEITITFTVAEDAHYHIPLLLSDNSFTTYRGS